MRCDFDGASLQIIPSPFAGRAIEIEIDAREIPNRQFVSQAAAQRVGGKRADRQTDRCGPMICGFINGDLSSRL